MQKASIQILKQLQKRKQSLVGSTQRKSVHHPKVVISQNNPFFIKQPKQPPASYQSHSNSSSNNIIGTKSSAEYAQVN